MDSWVSEYTPRASQIHGLTWLEDQTTKYNIIELPVGGGKSTLGLTYSNWLSGDKGGDSYILTPQKILQAQYETEKMLKPNGLFSLYGKGNYSCSELNTTCDLGLKFKGKTSCSSCIYRSALANALRSKNLVLNYTLALLQFGFNQKFEPRKLIICDEAHNLENQLVEFNPVAIGKKRALQMGCKLPLFRNIEDAYDWISTTYVVKLRDREYILECDVDEIVALVDPKNMSIADREMIKEHDKVKNHLEVVEMFLDNDLESVQEDFVVMSDKETLKFKSIYGRKNFHSMLSNQAEHFLFMSGTIIDKDEYCKNLGIDREDTSFLSVDSEFDQNKRPVVNMGGMKVNAQWKNPENNASRDKYLSNIKEILALHHDEKGIIHTGNFKVAEWLVEQLEGGTHTIYHHNPESKYKRESVIKAYMIDPKPSIMISPSMTEGVDLKDDKGRFAIIAKLAFPYLGDAWIKKRLELSGEWYAVEVVKAMIQACGRVVRSKTDYGTCYIVDESWNYFYHKNSYLFPKWWKDALVVIK